LLEKKCSGYPLFRDFFLAAGGPAFFAATAFRAATVSRPGRAAAPETNNFNDTPPEITF